MIERMIDEVERCIQNNCYIAALTIAITLPDSCGKAEYRIDECGKRYINWCKTYFDELYQPKFNSKYTNDLEYLDGEILYKLRCFLLHEDSLPKTLRIQKDNRLIDDFVLVVNEDYNNEGLISVSYNSDGTVAKRRMEINIILLCRRLCRIAKKYYEENKDKFDFLEFSFVDRLEWKRNVEKLKNKYSS